MKTKPATFSDWEDEEPTPKKVNVKNKAQAVKSKSKKAKSAKKGISLNHYSLCSSLYVVMSLNFSNEVDAGACYVCFNSHSSCVCYVNPISQKMI